MWQVTAQRAAAGVYPFPWLPAAQHAVPPPPLRELEVPPVRVPVLRAAGRARGGGGGGSGGGGRPDQVTVLDFRVRHTSVCVEGLRCEVVAERPEGDAPPAFTAESVCVVDAHGVETRVWAAVGGAPGSWVGAALGGAKAQPLCRLPAGATAVFRVRMRPDLARVVGVHQVPPKAQGLYAACVRLSA